MSAAVRRAAPLRRRGSPFGRYKAFDPTQYLLQLYRQSASAQRRPARAGQALLNSELAGGSMAIVVLEPRTPGGGACDHVCVSSAPVLIGRRPCACVGLGGSWVGRARLVGASCRQSVSCRGAVVAVCVRCVCACVPQLTANISALDIKDHMNIDQCRMCRAVWVSCGRAGAVPRRSRGPGGGAAARWRFLSGLLS